MNIPHPDDKTVTEADVQRILDKAKKENSKK